MKQLILARLGLAAVLVLTFNLQLANAQAQVDSAFTYQGFLTVQGAPANGVFDLQFAVFDAAAAGTRQGAVVAVNDLAVTNGVFTVTVDPGANVFIGAPRWLDIAVRPGDSAGAYSPLVPRQPITGTPSAITAGSVTGPVPAGQLVGTISPAQLPVNVALRFGGNAFSGNQIFNDRVGIGTPMPATALEVAGTVTATAFRGNGAGLTNLNIAGITGALPADSIHAATPTNMVWIREGSFAMGSPGFESNRAAIEGPQISVTISRGFWMGIHEVTQREYQSLVGFNPSYFEDDTNQPVETVSWNEAVSYCAALTASERTAGRIPTNWVYRLPTEAEWEYAARAGTATRFSHGEDPGYASLTNYAWIGVNSGGATHPVGQKAPNAWGLYDMYGNVLEWCQSWYGSYAGGSAIDPAGPATGVYRIYRGGSWNDPAKNCRSAMRDAYDPGSGSSFVGFRVVLSLGTP